MLREKEEDASKVNSREELCSIAAAALQRALESLDQFYVKFREKKNNVDLCGTTASVALLSPDGQHAVLCNIGDFRVALVGAWTVLDHKGHAPQQLPKMVLSHAHRVTDPEEMARIDAAGGFVEYGANGHRVNGVLGVSRAIGYCGMPDFADLVPSLSDSLIVRRDASKPALVALCSDGLFQSQKDSEAELIFQQLAQAEGYSSLEKKVAEALDLAGGGVAANNKDNATLLACLLPELEV